MKIKIKNICIFTAVFFIFINISCSTGGDMNILYMDYPGIDITESVYFNPTVTGKTSGAESVEINIEEWADWYDTHMHYSYITENPFIIYDIYLKSGKDFYIDTSDISFIHKLEDSDDSISFGVYFKPAAAGDLSDDIIINANSKTYHVKIYGRGV